jgi:hypothetical protein
MVVRQRASSGWVFVAACALPAAAILAASTSPYAVPASPTELFAPSHLVAETSVLTARPGKAARDAEARPCTSRVPASELNRAVASAGPNDVICLSSPTSSSVEGSPEPAPRAPLRTGTPSPVPPSQAPPDTPAPSPVPTSVPGSGSSLPDRTSAPPQPN